MERVTTGRPGGSLSLEGIETVAAAANVIELQKAARSGPGRPKSRRLRVWVNYSIRQ